MTRPVRRAQAKKFAKDVLVSRDVARQEGIDGALLDISRKQVDGEEERNEQTPRC